ERRKVWPNSKQLLRTAEGHAKTGHDFVEYQQRFMTGADLAQRLKKARSRRHASHVADYRFDDDGGNMCAMRGKSLGHRIHGIEWQRDRSIAEAFWHARRVGQSQCGDARARL